VLHYKGRNNKKRKENRREKKKAEKKEKKAEKNKQQNDKIVVQCVAPICFLSMGSGS